MMDVIFKYTREQAVEDGLLRRLDEWIDEEEHATFYRSSIHASLHSRDCKFRLGELFITTNASERLEARHVVTGLAWHSVGKWGCIGEDDQAMNDEALHIGTRLFSVYEFEHRFYIITEADRQATTILLPEDY